MPLVDFIVVVCCAGKRGSGLLRCILEMSTGDVEEIIQAFIDLPSIIILSSLSIGRPEEFILCNRIIRSDAYNAFRNVERLATTDRWNPLFMK